MVPFRHDASLVLRNFCEMIPQRVLKEVTIPCMENLMSTLPKTLTDVELAGCRLYSALHDMVLSADALRGYNNLESLVTPQGNGVGVGRVPLHWLVLCDVVQIGTSSFALLFADCPAMRMPRLPAE